MIGLLLVMACATIHLPEPSTAMVALAQPHSPGATMDSLAAGRTLVLQSCSGCHRPPAPTETAHEDWPGLLEDMRVEAKLKPEDAARIDTYLRASAALPPPIEDK